MPYHLGVDLGTTYTAAAIARDGRVETVTLGTRSVTVPSVVCLAGDQLLVGEPAARRAMTDPERVAREFKRRVGDPTPVMLGGTPMAADLLMARVLHWVVGQVSTSEGGPPDSLAVTHPANWHDYKLDLLRQAIHHVGLEVDRFVPEPVAAATMYASQRSLAPGTVVAVYDLGGGTFDAAVVRAGDDGFEIVGRPEGIERLGGIDFDHAVFRHVLDALELSPDAMDESAPGLASALAQLRQECVDAKEALSAETDVSIPVILPERHTEVRLTRGELEEKIRPALADTVVALRRAIGSADVAVTDVSAVLLVGGSSRIPLVGQLVGADLRRPIAIDARPKDAIPIGAALAVAELAPATPARRQLSTEQAPISAPAPEPSGTEQGYVDRTPAPMPSPAEHATVGRPEPAPPRAAAVSARPPVQPLAARPATPSGVSGVHVGLGGQGGRWWYVLAGAAGLVVVSLLVAFIVRGPSDDPAATSTSVPVTPSSSGTSASIDLDSLGAGGGQVGQPLPGDNWSPEARADFVEQCTGNQLGEAMEDGGIDPATGCGCTYDTVSERLQFPEFNYVWSDPDADPQNPILQALLTASLECVTAEGAP